MLAGMALDLSPRVVHKSRQESGWTKGVTSGGGTACTELPSKTQSADGRLGRTAADTSWGQGSQHCVPAPSCPSFPEWAAALGPGHPSLQPPPSESLAAAGLPPAPPPHSPAAGSAARAAGAGPAGGCRAGGSAPQPRSAPRSRSALPAAAPRLPSAHPRPLQCPGSFSRRPAGCAGLCLGLVFLSFGERGRIQWESGLWVVAPGSLRGAGMDRWMDRCRGACKSPLGPPPRLAAHPPNPRSAPSGALNRQGPGRSWPWWWWGAGRLPRDSKNPLEPLSQSLPSLLPKPQSPPHKDDPIAALAL